MEAEQQEWSRLFQYDLDDVTKEQLGMLLSRSVRREVQAALAEQREPELHYPALNREQVRTRIADLLQLQAEIDTSEPDAVVRRLITKRLRKNSSICF